MDVRASPAAAPLLSCVVAHWHCEDELELLFSAWPDDDRFELIVVDNGSRRPLSSPVAKILEPKRNLGFGGAINLAVSKARAPIVLLLNPDARPESDSLVRLLEGFERYPDAAGLTPKLVGEDGQSQFRWQLRRLPSALQLLLETLLIPARRAPDREPQPGTPVEQPAAAALALRRHLLVEVGGFDERFFPAWFEDIDLAQRLKQADHLLRYWPAARFRHRLGSTIRQLGYGPFLWLYYRNLERYLRKHYGVAWALTSRCLLPIGMILRLLSLPLRTPRRAVGPLDAARALGAVFLGATTGWRHPRDYAATWCSSDDD